jgi:hypothetical protein
LHDIHPPTSFPHLLPLSLVPTSPPDDLFYCPILWFCKIKKDIFVCLEPSIIIMALDFCSCPDFTLRILWINNMFILKSVVSMVVLKR